MHFSRFCRYHRSLVLEKASLLLSGCSVAAQWKVQSRFSRLSLRISSLMENSSIGQMSSHTPIPCPEAARFKQ